MATGENIIGLQKMCIKDLSPGKPNIVIVGIIIAKQRPRRFPANRDTTKERGVWNFTIRDSPLDYINVTCWGEADQIMDLYNKHYIGDVIEITKPRIDVRQAGDSREQYYPMVTSPFILILNEPSIARHEGRNYVVYTELLRLPTKPIASFVAIADLHNSNGNIKHFVDLLAAVRTVGSIRSFVTKTGNEQQVRDVVILDHSHHSLKISLWDPDIIARADFWKPRVTILFMTDMKIEWSTFNRCVVGSLTQRTVITEDPVGSEAEKLRMYAHTVALQPSAILDQLSCAIPNPYAIQNVMSIQQVLDKVQMIMDIRSARPEDNQFTALLYAFVTHLDLDGLSRTTSTRCGSCKTFIKKGCCSNEFCSTRTGNETLIVENIFDIRVMLSDQTGSLENCRLTGRTAETILNCTVDEFLNITDERKSRLKWKYLMERCAVRIMVLCMDSRAPLISILDCVLASASEVASRLPHY